MGVSVGRGGELAAVRSEEEERLGGDGEGGTLLGPPGQLLGCGGYASCSLARLHGWGNAEIGAAGSSRRRRLLTLNPEKTVGVGAKMQPETDPVAHQEQGVFFPFRL